MFKKVKNTKQKLGNQRKELKQYLIKTGGIHEERLVSSEVWMENVRNVQSQKR